MTEFVKENAWLAADVAIVAFLSVFILATCWFVATNLRDILRSFAWAARAIFARDAEPEDALPEIAATLPAAPALLSADMQWTRVTSVATTAIARARVMTKLQGAASEQLDAAQYALARLSAELKSLVAIDEMAAPPKADVRWLRVRRARREAPRRKLAA